MGRAAAGRRELPAEPESSLRPSAQPHLRSANEADRGRGRAASLCWATRSVACWCRGGCGAPSNHVRRVRTVRRRPTGSVRALRRGPTSAACERALFDRLVRAYALSASLCASWRFRAAVPSGSASVRRTKISFIGRARCARRRRCASGRAEGQGTFVIGPVGGFGMGSGPGSITTGANVAVQVRFASMLRIVSASACEPQTRF